MNDLLKNLLDGLSAIGKSHEEIYDTECRERMGLAVFDGFVRRVPNFVLSDDFGLYETEANQSVKQLLSKYIFAANNLTDINNVQSFVERLSSFQNDTIQSDSGEYYDDFFGFSNPSSFDSFGELKH